MQFHAHTDSNGAPLVALGAYMVVGLTRNVTFDGLRCPGHLQRPRQSVRALRGQLLATVPLR
jgi:hypothetical protein